MTKSDKFYIDGKWVDPISAISRDVINPSTEDVFASISLGSESDTDAAVAAAKQAFSTWQFSSKKERLELLESILAIYKKRGDEIGAAMSSEMGAPLDFAKGIQTSIGARHIQSFINVLDDFEFERPLRDDAPNDRIIYEPIGVCGLITPWNWPMNQITLKAIPALAAGCTMVLKPSEESPISAMIFTEVLDEAGVPKGVFNLINGDGLGVGTQLSGHKDVDMISFTGSTRAGMAISKNAADTIKRVSLELGGKGANIIFADADDEAVTRGALHCFENTGQSCNAPTRMLVEASRYEQAVQEAIAAANAVEVDQSSKLGEHIGPLVNQLQYDKVQNLIQTAIDEGTKLVAGGLGRPNGMNHGFFVKPTVFADCDPSMTIMQQEVFGPVLSMMPFSDEDEAIAIANETEYGLTNYVQTTDGQKANRMARKLRSGMVEMNGNFRSAGAPFGGYKQSGNGREGGVWGFEDFLEVKSIGGWFAGQ